MLLQTNNLLIKEQAEAKDYTSPPYSETLQSTLIKDTVHIHTFKYACIYVYAHTHIKYIYGYTIYTYTYVTGVNFYKFTF